MSYGLVAWCVGSMAACAAATVGATLLPQNPVGRPQAVAAIRLDTTDAARDLPVPELPAEIVGLTALDLIEVPEALVVRTSLFADGPRGPSLRPAFMEAAAELRLEEAAREAAPADPAGTVRHILDGEARSRDLSLARGLVRPPPRPGFLNRRPAAAAEVASADEPTAPESSLVLASFPATLWATPEPSTARTGRALQSGVASWYGPGFHGRKTASGERFNQNEMTAAHRSLPFGTRVKVVDTTTGRSVVVRINDRGPYAHGRVIDLSRASAEALGMRGLSRVQLVSAE